MKYKTIKDILETDKAKNLKKRIEECNNRSERLWLSFILTDWIFHESLECEEAEEEREKHFFEFIASCEDIKLGDAVHYV